MIPLPASRRPHLFLGVLSLIALWLFVQNSYHPGSALLKPSFPYSHPEEPNEYAGLEAEDLGVRSRVERLRSVCQGENAFEREYGRTNIRMSRAYEGSHHRIRQFLQKALRGEPLSISVIGGSVTKGHQVQKDEIWFHKFGEWFTDLIGDGVEINYVNGAAPATGSDYFSFCFPLHIPLESDLIFIELAVNDEGILEHVENMENLLRGLLDLPNRPAVILTEAVAFSNGGMGGGGGRMHLPVAQYFDVPVINQRHPLANHIARYPQLIRPYFSQDWWGNPDMRHMNARGHRDLGMLAASLIQDAACIMLSEPTFHVSQPPTVQSEQYGILPRLNVLGGWNPNLEAVVPHFNPTCLSTRARQPQFNLTPSWNDGRWEYWVHPEHRDKPYLVAREPGATVKFKLETNVGVVKLYSLKSKSFGLGAIECWADDERDKAVVVEGYWTNEPNIGRFATIRSDLKAGVHTITCELLEKTSDPEGGHEFRLISIMR
uniref:Capsular associated protein n=1 Tax=Kwoniella dejecticola CBS 10117 TaxID=1296121 RepID=A0A1A5ZY82_9TREE|nr:uncharacterized protein I303_07540 [Kwoniella dejecticola CBS 10117]OBR82772.1 hypothetical protein I303_07540 [Kwoniella dejecticola CBS 10117]